MSLLWRRKKQRLGLCADRIFLSKSKVVDVQAPGAGEPEWRPVVEALPGVLAGLRDHDVAVVLGDQFARYALMQWSEALNTEEQWLTLARHRFAAVHGPGVASWEIKVTETAPRGPRLACAVDRELIEALASAFVGANVRLTSVQPFLVAAFNRIRGEIGTGSCWLVVEEPARLTLAFIQRGVWVAIRTRRVDGRWKETLQELLARESAFLALTEPCTRVIVCAQGEFDPQKYESFRTHAVSYRELALAWD